MSHPIRVALVVTASMISAVAAAVALSVVEVVTGFPLLGFTLLFVIPVWMLGCGTAAAIGFFAASRLLHVRPIGGMVLVPLATAVVSFGVTNWFTFSRHDFAAGRTFADVMTFGHYLRVVTTESGLSLGSSFTIERLGWFGWVIAAMEIVGAGAGGWLAVAALRGRPWCDASARFMRRVDGRTQRFESQTPFHRVMAEIHRLADQGDLAAAVQVLPHRQARSTETENGRFALTVDCYRCPSCGREQAVVTTHERRSYSWNQTTQGALRSRSGDEHAPIVSPS